MRIIRKISATFLSFMIDIFSNTWISSYDRHVMFG